jgi:hypothetical protein
MGYDKIDEKVKSGVYEVAKKLPQRPKLPRLRDKASPKEIREYADNVEQYDENMKDYNKKYKEWMVEVGKKRGEFMDDIREMFREGGATEKQAARAASLAWEHGHSAGYSEVLICASDLCDIFRD